MQHSFAGREAMRARRLVLPAVTVLVVGFLVNAAWSTIFASEPTDSKPAPAAAAFVSGSAKSRPLLNRRFSPAAGDADSSISPVTMFRGSMKNNKYNKPKKLHIRFMEHLDRSNSLMTPHWLQKLTMRKEPNLEQWSQTLKLNFPEGEDDVVTEQEVMDHFTTDDYKPEAVIVGHSLPHDPLKHAYVHFATNEETRKARKEKNGGAIGKASEVKAVYTDEKKWIRIRDGVHLTGFGRAGWMKAYGKVAQPEFMDDWGAESGQRRHPVYPE
eukprot:TRINITY_DN7006_c0_g2_i2.p1 TRINITY_DN7006_c0_g2~~TRINITY_DN7006_c0_g2_i2.p1  ORF type:complete len:270 (+),score=68.15 TRINITY_DN7006_c0_g2_i2:103-912(+)